MTDPTDPSTTSRRIVLGAALASPIALALFVVAKAARNDPVMHAINLLDFIPDDFHASILGRTIDNSAGRAAALAGHIQNAIDTAAAKRRRLIIPAGVYNVAPREFFEAEAGPCRRCFAIRSHMHIDAEAVASFRIVDSVSTDEKVVFMCMFGSNAQLTDISWRGLEMDMNGQKNPISPRRASGEYSLINQAHIFISGTPGGQAARASNVQIENCRFLNTPGASCVVLAQSNVRNVKLGNKWLISECEFIDGGLDSPDHSAVYAWATDVTCRKCVFKNAVPKTQVGGQVAFEVHGSRQIFSDNRVSNYYQGVWIDGNRSEHISTDITVSNNSFDNISAFGIMFYGTECRMKGVSIVNNLIRFDDTIYPGVDLKIGVGCLSDVGQHQAIIRHNNIRSGSRRTATSGVSLQSPTKVGDIHDNFYIDNNSFHETTFGVQIVTNPVCSMGSIYVNANSSLNLSRAGSFLLPQGVGIDFQLSPSLIRKLHLVGNKCVDTRGSEAQCAFGIRVQGKVGDLLVHNNSASGMISADYAEGNVNISSRTVS